MDGSTVSGEYVTSLEHQPAEGVVVEAPHAAGRADFMVGNSPAMAVVFDQIRRFATCDAPVLITGESGTGKELAARAIHDRSARAKEAFVPINCAALPATLIASELFGYEKGAFTGANGRKRGQIEHAHRGTLFLDEIGDMPADLQTHLLRFLQEGEIVRVGGQERIKVNVRVIAATNAHVREAIAAGRLREDLFFRLNVLGLKLPPLRERQGDVRVLASFFLHRIARELERPVDAISPAAAALLEVYPWPGNVRELIATLRRAVVLANSHEIQVADLGLESPVVLPRPAGALPHSRTPVERERLRAALELNNYNISKTANELGVSRLTVYRMMQRHEIARPA